MGDSSFYKNAATTYTSGQGSIATAPNPSNPGPARSSFYEAAGTPYTPSASIGGVVSFNGRSGTVVPLANDYTFAQLASKPTTIVGYGLTDAAPLASPTLTGTPVAPTATLGTNTTQIATTAFVLANASAGSTFATEAQAETGASTTISMSPATVSQAILTNAASFKNIAGRNGGFEVWQLGTSVSVPASTAAYTADGWYLLTGASQATTVSRQTGLTNGSSYCCRVSRDAVQTGTATYVFGFPLDVDELKKMAGQSVMLSFSVSTGAGWSPASGTLTYALITGTGAPVKQYLGTYAGSVNAIVSTVNLAAPNAATAVFSPIAAIGSNIGQAEIQFKWTPTGTSPGTDFISFDDVSLTVVPAGLSAAKPSFERSDLIWDIERCLRHYEKSYDLSTAPGTITTNGTSSIRVVSSSFIYTAVFKKRKRALPAITTYSSNSGASGMLYENGVGDAASGIDEVGDASATFHATMTSGNRSLAHWVADARI